MVSGIFINSNSNGTPIADRNPIEINADDPSAGKMADDADKLSFKDSLSTKERVGVIIASGIACGGLAGLAVLLATYFALGSIVLWGVILAGTGGALTGLNAAFYWMFLSYPPLSEKFLAPEIAANIVPAYDAMKSLTKALKTPEDGNFSAANGALMELFDSINELASHSGTQRFGLCKNIVKVLQIDGDNAQKALQFLENMKSRFAALKDSAKINRRAIEDAHQAEIEFMGTLQPKEVNSKVHQTLCKYELRQMLFDAELAEPGKKYEIPLFRVLHLLNSRGLIVSMQCAEISNFIRKSNRNYDLICANKNISTFTNLVSLESDCSFFLSILNCEKSKESVISLKEMLHLKFLSNTSDAHLNQLCNDRAAAIGGKSKINLPSDDSNLLDLSIAMASNGKEKANEIDDIVGKLQDKYRENEDLNIIRMVECLKEGKRNFIECLSNFKELNDNPFNPKMRKNITCLAELIDETKAKLKGGDCDTHGSLADALKCKMHEAIDCTADRNLETAESIKNLLSTIGFCTEDALDAAEKCHYLMLSEYCRGIKSKYTKYCEEFRKLKNLLGKINMFLATLERRL
ncbi:MAG: hypothetical protein LBI69_04235 [Puniceicoccales bacterium]|nr:hypothetical protein [Puniceicoccales bacterium]